MTKIQQVIGAPVWDRAWSLPLWFASVRANVEPESTGLVFVVPGADSLSREAIAQHASDFAFVEVIRDRGEPVARGDRAASDHTTLAAARNAILSEAALVRPDYFISWDSDLLLPQGALQTLIDIGEPLVTPWAWLNRQSPKKTTYKIGGVERTVLYQPPINATAMGWDRRFNRGAGERLAFHYPAKEFNQRASGVWECGVALAFQLMRPSAYLHSSYRPHRYGEDIPFNRALADRGIRRVCCGDVVAVHLYDREAYGERDAGWPAVMDLAQQRPLAATYSGPRPIDYEMAGFFPLDAIGDWHGNDEAHPTVGLPDPGLLGQLS